MNYSLFNIVTKVVVSMEVKGQPGIALAASPLLSSQSSDLFHVFHVSTPPSHEIACWVIYIVDFSSRRICGGKEN
jgi:hypothetical protein